MVKTKLSGKNISKKEKELIGQASERFIAFEELMNDRTKMKDSMLKASVEMEELKRAFRVKREQFEDMEHAVHLNEAEVIKLMPDDDEVTQYMLHGGEAGPGKITAEELYAYYPDLKKKADKAGTLMGDEDDRDSEATGANQKGQESGKGVQDQIMGFFEAQKRQQELERELKAQKKKMDRGLLPAMKKRKGKKRTGGGIIDEQPSDGSNHLIQEKEDQLGEIAGSAVFLVEENGSSEEKKEHQENNEDDAAV
uniref:Uncharacterized protein n=1 Tax=Heterosigma akashiwo TaxID=2829 RepID=A0A7S3Y6F8_HETAK